MSGSECREVGWRESYTSSRGMLGFRSILLVHLVLGY